MINEKEHVEVLLLFFGKAREIIGVETFRRKIPRSIDVKQLYTLVFEKVIKFKI